MKSIRQEVTFDTTADKLFRALVDSSEFAKFSGAPATGTAKEGDSFSGFGGHVTGRHIELVAGKRVVQAWRAKTWPEGLYSLVRFELVAEGPKTRVVFDHVGYPQDSHDHLDEGWAKMYWAPMREYVAS